MSKINPSKTPERQKILVLRLGAMGDLIHLSATLASIKAQHPNCDIHLMTSAMYQEMANCIPSVSKVWTFNKNKLGDLCQKAFRARREGFTAGINLQPSVKTHLFFTLAGILPCASYKKQKLKQRGREQRSLKRFHAVEDFYQPFRRILDLSDSAHFRTKLLLPNKSEPDSISATKNNPTYHIGIIPGVGAKRSNRAWSTKQYQELLQQLIERVESAALPIKKLNISIIGGPDEVELGNAIATTHPQHVTNACGTLSILETAQLLQDCDLVIGGDTGPTHLASSLGCPMVSIYGPTAVSRTGPVSSVHADRITTIVPPEDLLCWPCEAPVCPLSDEENMACMHQITVQDVLNAVTRKIES